MVRTKLLAFAKANVFMKLNARFRVGVEYSHSFDTIALVTTFSIIRQHLQRVLSLYGLRN